MNLLSQNFLKQEAITLLKDLIKIPSYSREEDKTADLLFTFLEKKNVKPSRQGNNVWAKNLYFDKSKPTILLNSHHDTVKPNGKWTVPPHDTTVEKGKLTGLGSNDAGGALVALGATFLWFYDKQNLPFNLIYAGTAEEEISGENGVKSILGELGDIAFAIVGEPTGMELAIAEKGLMVLDCTAYGKSGHAARNEGINAITKAMESIEWFNTYSFMNESETLGPVRMSVTQISAGTQHNVVPASCQFVVDVRTTDAYTNEEVLDIINKCVSCEVTPRSTRLQPSGIPMDHPAVISAQALGFKTFGSATLSDQALLPFHSVKMGPGLSERSHTADEFIYLKEIEEGIELYIKWLSSIKEL
ncbi:M20 family metallo-hydrolase [Limibacter armeniacum]|uniref:M20 family metallo-hydrolase n=1 Tax=Limibacter armeniacum TaxID=466084 RepID=UPI002FE6AB88